MSRPFFPGALLSLTPGADTLVALDIDGTILGHDGSLSRRVTAAIDRLVDDGTHVVLSTGRSLTAVLPVIADLGLAEGWAVCSNGAVTISFTATEGPGAQVDYRVEDLITFDPAPTLRKLRDHVPEAFYAVEVLGEGFKVTRSFPLGELTGRQDVVSFEDLCAAPASRVTVRAPDLSVEEFRDIVERTGLHGVSYSVGWSAWLDLTPDGVSKASALDVVRQRLAVAEDATLAVGDGRNDIEMLGWAGYGVAMGEADDLTRAAADYVTDGIGDDGLVPVLVSLYASELSRSSAG